MPFLSYEQRAETITTHAWETWTNNGLTCRDDDDRFQTTKTVQDAVANSYIDDMDDLDWLKATLKLLGHDRELVLPHVHDARNTESQEMNMTRYIVRDCATKGCDFLLWGDGDRDAAVISLIHALSDGLDVELIAMPADDIGMGPHSRS